MNGLVKGTATIALGKGADAAVVNQRIALVQGTAVIAVWDYKDVGFGVTLETEPQVVTLTDFTNLRIRMTTTSVEVADSVGVSAIVVQTTNLPIQVGFVGRVGVRVSAVAVQITSRPIQIGKMSVVGNVGTGKSFSSGFSAGFGYDSLI